VANIYKVQAIWTGWGGGPGYSNFYFRSGDTLDAELVAMTGAVRSFFASFTLGLPTPIAIQVSPVVQQIDPANGHMTAEFAAGTTPAVLAGAGGSNFSSPVGACVIWRTSVNLGTRLLKGKTFLVPLSTGAYDVDGTLLLSRVTEIRTAAATLASFTTAAGVHLQVWHRPVGGVGGSAADVASSAVNDRSAILRTRRA